MTPIDAEFRVGTMGLGWDLEAQTVVVELLAVTDTEFDASVVLDDAEEGPDAVRVFLTPASARQFAARSMPSSPRAARRARCVTSRSIPPATFACAPTATGAERWTGRRMTPSRDDVEALSRGELTVIGRIRSASNATFLCEAQRAGHRTHCVYKPIAVRRRCGISPMAPWRAEK